ncbi:MAG: GYD domain-containing protein [Actinobacteria bacterium]|nr:MAG: GYD domain-containing protein [Actinomycetota bacterium]
MPLYMSTFGYKSEVWAGLVKSPENREEMVGRILEEAGCKLRGLWYAFGEADGFALIEAPDNTTAAGLSIAITSSGAFRKFETTPLMTQAETLDALHVAANVHYAPPAEPVHV